MTKKSIAELFPDVEFRYGLMHKENKLLVSKDRMLTEEMSEAMSFSSEDACKAYGSEYVGNYEEFQVVLVVEEDEL